MECFAEKKRVEVRRKDKTTVKETWGALVGSFDNVFFSFRQHHEFRFCSLSDLSVITSFRECQRCGFRSAQGLLTRASLGVAELTS